MDINIWPTLYTMETEDEHEDALTRNVFTVYNKLLLLNAFLESLSVTKIFIVKLIHMYLSTNYSDQNTIMLPTVPIFSVN